jgi:hypothetical protein
MIKREELKELYRVCGSTREMHVDLYAYWDATVVMERRLFAS